MAVILVDKKIVGERLKALRGSRTQKEVADAIGVSAMTISQYEQGERMPKDEIKAKLANYYRKSVGSIFFTQ